MDQVKRDFLPSPLVPAKAGIQDKSARAGMNGFCGAAFQLKSLRANLSWVPAEVYPRARLWRDPGAGMSGWWDQTVAIIGRRSVIVGTGLLVASPALAQAANPKVIITTDHGVITAEIFQDKAPITAGNFLRYVDTKRYDDAQFYRAVRAQGAPDIGLIEMGIANHPQRLLPPIKHEPTTQTGLHNIEGTLSLARFAPGTGQADVSIVVGDGTYLDADPSQTGDNLGFAAFGRVTDGMDVVKAILALPTNGVPRNPTMAGQILSPPVTIATMRRA